MTTPALFAAASATVADRPLLTYYDDATGERLDLSAAALGDWAARTARLLHEGCGLAAAGRVAVLLPAHWQSAAVLLGAWSAGMAVSFRLAATAGLPAVGVNEDEPFDAVFVARPRVDDWLDHVPEARHRFVLGLAPGAAPLAEVPDGYRDFIVEVGAYSGTLPAYATSRASDAASVDGTSYREWGTVARGIAESLDLRAGDRLLVDAAEHEHAVKWLLAPFSVGATVVLCANLDRGALDARIAAERVTRVMV